MPVIGIPTKMLEQRLGVEIPRDELVTHLLHLGCDVEGFATLRRFKCARCGQIAEITETQEPPVECPGCGLDFRQEEEARKPAGEIEVIRMELLAVRPDIFDPGGLARTLRAYLGEETGLKRYTLIEARTKLRVDATTQSDECPRPAIAAAVVRGLRLDDDMVKAIMKLQENLHWALGRDRKHASIGVYDLDTVEGPFVYRGVEPRELGFVPLGFSPGEPGSEMTPQEILEKHPKGVAFAHLLSGFKRYPLLEDAKGTVLSMPPIINSEATRVRDETTGFFIDVTGTSFEIANKTLAVLVTSLMELQPDLDVEKVKVEYPGGKGESGERETPDLTVQRMELEPEETSDLLGLELGRGNVVELLRRMGHGASAPASGPLSVEVPAYRSDILHPRDLMEDVAIAYGYHNIEPSLVPTLTVGGAHPREELGELVRTTMIGLGYWEVMTLSLTAEKRAFGDMRIEPHPSVVTLENPISTEQTQLRVSLLPGLLETLGANTHRELPQKLFEVGPVTFVDESSETGASERLFAAGALIDARAGAADARAACQALLEEIGMHPEIKDGKLGCYLEGRCGEIYIDGKRCGSLGEIHPETLERFGLGHPVAAFEVDLTLASTS